MLTHEKCKVRLRVRVMVTEWSAEGKVMVTGRSTGCEVSQVLTPEKCKVRLRVRVRVTERSAEGKVRVIGRSTCGEG